MTTILGVTATLLLLANILQAVVALTNKNRVQEAEDGRDHAISMYNKCLEDMNTWKREYGRAENESQRANKLRDQIELEAKEVEASRDNWKGIAVNLQAERANLYFRNSKGQIAKLHP